MNTILPPPLRPSSTPPPPSTARILHAINTCTSPAALPLLRTTILSDHSLLRSTTVVSAFFLACHRLRHIPPALSLFSQLRRPHIFVFNSLLRFLLPSLTYSPLPLFRRLLHLAVRPNRYTFPLLLTSLSSLQDLRLLHSHIAKSGFADDLHVRNAVLARYATAAVPDLAPAEQLFDEMSRPDVVAWTTLITTYKNHGRSFQGLTAFRRMLSASVAPNRVTMVAALGACAAHGSVDTGVWIHSYMRQQGWEVDVVLGTALIDMYGKCGRVEDGVRVFLEMAERNVYTWNSLIGALVLARSSKEALQWFFRMEVEAIRPDAITLLGVLCACAHLGLVDIGKKMFDLIVHGEYGFAPGIKHFGCMVDLLGSSGHLDDAIKIVKTMPLQPNAVIWGLLLRGCRAHGDLQLSEFVTRQLVELEPENAAHYVLLSNLYAETGRWREAEEVWRWMRKNGLRKDASWSLRMLEERRKNILLMHI